MLQIVGMNENENDSDIDNYYYLYVEVDDVRSFSYVFHTWFMASSCIYREALPKREVRG